MHSPGDRRHFLKAGSIAAAVTVAGKAFSQDSETVPPLPQDPDAPPAVGNPSARPAVPDWSDAEAEMDGFSRFEPSRGNDPDSPYYIGKMMPGFRPASAGPAPFHAPDLEKLPHKMVDGVKEFHLVPQAVQREFLPGYYMNVYGFNGIRHGHQ